MQFPSERFPITNNNKVVHLSIYENEKERDRLPRVYRLQINRNTCNYKFTINILSLLILNENLYTKISRVCEIVSLVVLVEPVAIRYPDF